MVEGHKSALAEAVDAHRLSGAELPHGQQLPGQQGELFSPVRHSELDQAIAEARAEEVIEQARFEAEEEARRQADLIGGEASEGPRGPGRPPGSRNLRTEKATRYYTTRHGDPLEQAVKLGAIPIRAPGVLEALAKRLDSTRLEAAKFWLANNIAVLPYLRAKLSSIEVNPAGSPGYFEGELVDASITPEASAIVADQRVPDVVDEAPEEPGATA